jgi:hypothetical protein
MLAGLGVLPLVKGMCRDQAPAGRAQSLHPSNRCVMSAALEKTSSQCPVPDIAAPGRAAAQEKRAFVLAASPSPISRLFES